MSTVAHRLATRSTLLAAVETQRDVLAASEEADEQRGTLSPASIAALVASGVLRMKLPQVLGGFEADLVTQMEVLERLAIINPAVAWCAMVGATSLAMAGAFLPAAGVARMFTDGDIPCGAIVVTPTGVATAVTGGYRLNGRWGFASGVRHAQWMVTIAQVKRSDDSPPDLHFLVLPVAQCEILDNWQVLGLRGTGSCDIVITDVFVPAEMTFAVTDPARRGGALYCLGLPAFVAYEHAGFALGIARRVLDDLVTLVQNKRRGYGPVGNNIAERGSLQRVIGHAEMRLRAARALVVETNEQAWSLVNAGQILTAEHQCTLRSAASYATEVSSELVAAAFRHAGAGAIYASHTMQRCLRDINVAAQHYMVADTAYEQLGRARLGYTDINPMG